MKTEGYKIAAMAGVKSMQKLWLLKEIDEHSVEKFGTEARGLEHLDVLGLIYLYAINVRFIDPHVLAPLSDFDFREIGKYYDAWSIKRMSKGYTVIISKDNLITAQSHINIHVANK